MICDEIVRVPPHFERRVYKRAKDIELPLLLKMVKEKIRLKNYIFDEKHPGREGPRYSMYIEIGEKTYKTIVEKTSECIIPITFYPYSRQAYYLNG